ncbi:reductase [Aerococcus mictus]|nr:hypothetical protein [Aerococcus mictus]OFM52190.1 hypothetical protein HMPREF2680_04640 [Aerococcus mictus]PMB92874.1 reductase [Aerococcus mictus]RAV69856.1 reductase [Aerococcus mictus]RAV71002.1 reductase [Aerococcus mictus]RAV80931.1 reductase [Aerococcus mictus]
MLIPYISNYEKVVMGLLSYLDAYKSMDDLMAEMKRIKIGKRQLYLWRDEETDNIVGIIGFDQDEEKELVLVRYSSVNPSFDQNEITYAMLTALTQEFPMYTISGSLAMSDILKGWALHEQRTMPHIIHHDGEGL